MAIYKLKEIPQERFMDVQLEMARYLPHSFQAHGMMDISLRYGKFKTLDMRVLGAEDFRSFICITPYCTGKNIQSVTIFWDVNEVDDETVGKLLSHLPINGTMPFIFVFPSYQLKEKLDVLITQGCIGSMRHFSQVFADGSKGILLTISKDDIVIPKISSEYVIGPLLSSSASYLLSKWNFSYFESTEGLEERLFLLKGVAGFHVTNDNGIEKQTLVAWTHQYMCGAIGMTYTLSDHRKKGLAASLTLTLAKTIIKEGRVPYVMIDIRNTKSLNFHLNIGFKVIGDTGLSVFCPPELRMEDLTGD